MPFRTRTRPPTTPTHSVPYRTLSVPSRTPNTTHIAPTHSVPIRTLCSPSHAVSDADPNHDSLEPRCAAVPSQFQARTRRRAILFYGGPPHRPDGAGLDDVLERRDWDVHMADTAADPRRDLSEPTVVAEYCTVMQNGALDVAAFAPVCTSLSGSLQPRVRDSDHSMVLRTPFRARSDHIGRNEVRNGLGMGNLGTSCPAARNEVVDLGTRLPKGRNEFGMIILCSDTRIEYMQQSTVFKHFETH